jgi:hypothetical protein
MLKGGSHGTAQVEGRLSLDLQVLFIVFAKGRQAWL